MNINITDQGGPEYGRSRFRVDNGRTTFEVAVSPADMETYGQWLRLDIESMGLPSIESVIYLPIECADDLIAAITAARDWTEQEATE